MLLIPNVMQQEYAGKVQLLPTVIRHVHPQMVGSDGFSLQEIISLQTWATPLPISYLLGVTNVFSPDNQESVLMACQTMRLGVWTASHSPLGYNEEPEISLEMVTKAITIHPI